MKSIKLLVTGGSGLVGHALQSIYPDAIYLSSKEYDLTNEQDVQNMFQDHQPTHVIHLAARVGGIKDNMDHPAEFFHENILMNTHVTHYAYKYDVEKFIGVLSNCAYPDVVKAYPLTEEQLFEGLPPQTNFAYAISKRALETQIQSYRQQYNSPFFSVIPCNMYGPHDSFDEQKSHYIPSLIRKIHQAQQHNKTTLQLLGSGKPLRQYLFAEDLAQILLILLKKYSGTGPINVAPQQENPSIKEIATTALGALDVTHLTLSFDSSFPDGQYRKDLSIDKLLKINGDFEFTPLSEGIQKTYEWYTTQTAQKPHVRKESS